MTTITKSLEVHNVLKTGMFTYTLLPILCQSLQCTNYKLSSKQLHGGTSIAASACGPHNNNAFAISHTIF